MFNYNIMENKYENLEKFAINLNERALQGKLDPVIGRDEEIRRVLQILSRRTKNNPILVGEPGVGKTAISEGIAQKIEKSCDLFPRFGCHNSGCQVSGRV